MRAGGGGGGGPPPPPPPLPGGSLRSARPPRPLSTSPPPLTPPPLFPFPPHPSAPGRPKLDAFEVIKYPLTTESAMKKVRTERKEGREEGLLACALSLVREGEKKNNTRAPFSAYSLPLRFPSSPFSPPTTRSRRTTRSSSWSTSAPPSGPSRRRSPPCTTRPPRASTRSSARTAPRRRTSAWRPTTTPWTWPTRSASSEWGERVAVVGGVRFQRGG